MIKTNVYFKANGTKYYLWRNEAGLYSWDANERIYRSMNFAINSVRNNGNVIWCNLK